MLLHTAELLCSRRHGLLCCSLFGSHWSGHSLAQFVLHMEEIRGVMHTEVMGNIREEARGFITRRLNHLALERR
jgi:hypothetical protein